MKRNVSVVRLIVATP